MRSQYKSKVKTLHSFIQLLPPLFVKVIEKYLQSTHAPTHRDYTMTVLDIFSVDRCGESEGFLSDLHNRSEKL